MPSDAAPPHLAGHPPLPRLGQYELRRQVGSGAMGVVHEGHDVDLDRPVAIKLGLLGLQGRRRRRSGQPIGI